MLNKLQGGYPSSIDRISLAVLSLTLCFLLPLPMARAQNFRVIHTFTGTGDGASPYAGVTVDSAGNLYGTTEYGGFFGSDCAPLGCGTIFRLEHGAGGWIQTALYAFKDEGDGRSPQSRVVFGPDGALYGVTSQANYNHPATIFRLAPAPSLCTAVVCPWKLTVLQTVGGGSCAGLFDVICTMGDLTFDRQGNIYGTLVSSGQWGFGSVYELVHASNGWTMSTLYSFPIPEWYAPDAYWPYAGVTFDSQGNLWGASLVGGGDGQDNAGPGGVFKLTYANGEWTEQFAEYSGAANALGGLITDQQGNLYGATFAGGSGLCVTPYNDLADGCGIVYKINSLMQFSSLYNFQTDDNWSNDGGPMAALSMDDAGDLYGTASGDSDTYGAVFSLSAGGWAYTSLHDFTGGSDGATPVSTVSFDSQGNMFGTASTGGESCAQTPRGCGVVWEISQQSH